jgi:hypothetical protein
MGHEQDAARAIGMDLLKVLETLGGVFKRALVAFHGEIVIHKKICEAGKLSPGATVGMETALVRKKGSIEIDAGPPAPGGEKKKARRDSPSHQGEKPVAENAGEVSEDAEEDRFQWFTLST